MARPDNFFTTLNGIPVHYDRPPEAPYGSRGIEYDFYATQELESKLDACFAELEAVCPRGRPEVITSAGAWVDKPDSYHATGEAFDLDGIHWADEKFICLDFPSDRRFYLGVDAVLRKNFPTVLNYYYNQLHHDHLHMEPSGQMEFNKQAPSEVFFLQAALTYVLNIPVAIDGDWGPETAGGTARALHELNISGELEDLETWTQFLTAISTRAFGEVIPSTAKRVTVRKQTINNVKKWFATVDEEPEFVVGKEVPFADQNGRGLSSYEGLKYKPDDYRAEYGFWADFIYPTACCESVDGVFTTLNTYDRAYFTFGFMQFAAHVRGGDFAKYFRGLLALPEAADYFPDLELKDSLVHQRVNGGFVNLETNTEPPKLAKYLNPDFHVMEPVEAENAARLIHWTKSSLASRKLQVEISVETFRQILSGHAATYSLDGKPDKVCLVIADIYHHGRGGPNRQTKIKNALATNGDMEKAYRNLLEVGMAPGYIAERIDKLKTKIAAMVLEGRLGGMKYSAAQRDFIPL